MKNGQTGVQCWPARLLCIIAALSDASLLHPPAPASAPWNRAASGQFSAPARTGTLPAPAQAPAAPALISGRSEILPWLPSFPERFLLQSMRVFRLLCRQIELDFAAAREIVLPRGFSGAGRLAIQGLFAPELSTPERRLRAYFAFCCRWTLAAHSRQYFARPEWARKSLPQT